MGKRLVYKPDKANDFRPHSDGSESFSAFAVSSQMRKPLLVAAFEIIGLAKADVGRSQDDRNGHYSDGFSVNEVQAAYVKPKRGPRQARAVAEIQNDYWTAPAMEFGSGDPSIGLSSGEDRPQGGWNKPKRPLGRAASKIGDWNE